MKQIEIPYGKGTLFADIHEERLAGILVAQGGAGGDDDVQRMLVQTALERPIGTPRLREIAKHKHRVLVITSDHTRPLPSALTLPLLLKEIRTENPSVDIRILIATGTHRAMTGEEMRAKFGDAMVDGETILTHHCDDSGMVHKGMLPSGGALWLNPLVDWAELIVSEGFIEPHFFAGFSGGRKSILPGIAARETILYNHNAQFLQSPHAVQGSLAHNPLHRDMLYAAKAVGLAFILNVLLDADKHIVGAYAGSPEATHEKGCAECLRRTAVPRILGDIVITSNGGYPLDQNVYQSVKGMTAAEACVRPGGVIIMCAALGDGAGSEAFYRWLADAPNPISVKTAIETITPEETQEDQWEAQILARILCHATVIFITGAESRNLIEAMHMTWAGSLPDALSIAEERIGKDAKIVVIPDGVGVIIR